MDYFLTKEKLREFESELEQLRTEGRKEVSEDLRVAKELGDLSENSEYIAARERQQRVENRIAELEHLIRNAVIITKRHGGHEVIEVGSTVEVAHDDQITKFLIVGSSEANPEGGAISHESPLGQALMGHKVGEIVVVKSPRGRGKYKIKSVV
ncbi:MAG: transcription elongation factor GreA [Candidatus Colwellbacteria bacterium RBG_13_48_8]|uniref:Transcription elongation factor GreA n=1 Tax=Candidatus Colwellbacteria bacterium RBG_13_48_8 TaxID=1797685 RepID=A0A1G1YZ15_9BACT|nr:MAG: transcription elongation factor GreA [Candidatus Colwellbacteria bacterium RBG_13_48_8]